ncbi:MAG: SAM-dependent chlorinase/fluorinase [Gammaproteobacteria bacterium]|nr:SAM-dependent chlorinase/fluorinase [Gammaproteobacteria bacterium]
MIVLFTDFGVADPYVGQMHAVLASVAPQLPVIDLFHAAPNFDIRAAAYLLPAYTREFPVGTIFIGVVDPGVGGPRRPVMLKADERWYVGPDNGLFHIVARRAAASECYVIRWQAPRLSASFHGRDLFAPVAARLARGEMADAEPTTLTTPDGPPWPDDLAAILYIDHYGNAITGIRAAKLASDQTLRMGKVIVKYARTFTEASPGTPFWYENANGLVEIALNRASVAKECHLHTGDAVTVM